MKKSKTVEEQLQILEKRGLVIENRDRAIEILRNVNYYTLTGYLFPFKQGEKYQNGTSMNLAIKLYHFDNEIRNILMALMVEAEEKLKTRIAYNIAIAHPGDPLIYTDINYFKSANDHSRFMADFQNNVRNNREVPFVKHHIQKYRSQFPIWVAVSLFTLGNLKYLYKNIPSRDRKNISREFNLSPKTFDSWIDTLRILRNKLAHNMRLYRTTFQRTPKLEKHHTVRIENNRLFANFVLLKYLLDNSEVWKEAVINLDRVLIKYQYSIELSSIGFPKDWKTILLS
ncbi:Abi family protein [Streptococcus lutetiensis]|uniref:Abi family protein n=1 Tax=Streptococcus lutetiensis TaxID=150055 RepID=UPI001BD98023|nr:Abi family protein [Streptococcus lutetiensis]MBT0902458.1 Abi family protein [Streptococcus lutetiensis]MBT0922370.1 Abi family protein [Streptococcus lutetiensis]